MTTRLLPGRLGLCVILGAMCAGCIIIPTDYYHSDSRRNVRDETTTAIIPGQTTKEDLFLALGEPDEVSPDGSRLVYRWVKVKAIWAAGSHYGGGGGGEIPKEYQHIITFDGCGVVAHRESQSRWCSSVACQDER